MPPAKFRAVRTSSLAKPNRNPVPCAKSSVAVPPHPTVYLVLARAVRRSKAWTPQRDKGQCSRLRNLVLSAPSRRASFRGGAAPDADA